MKVDRNKRHHRQLHQRHPHPMRLDSKVRHIGNIAQLRQYIVVGETSCINPIPRSPSIFS
jgi:hypothetical protein